jgi:hypothetical protein
LISDTTPLHVENEVRNDRLCKYLPAESDQTPYQNLLVMFGKDAKTKTDKSKGGLILDDVQKEIIPKSFHCNVSGKLTSYKDSYRHDLPVHESCENWFQVPKLDDTVES